MGGLDRREFLRRTTLAGAGVALLGSPLLAACGSDSKTASTVGATDVSTAASSAVSTATTAPTAGGAGTTE